MRSASRLRVLDGRFMVINQPWGRRDHGRRSQYLIEFVTTMKSSGFVAQSLARHGIEGAMVAP
jgi:polar amino acid transport system substrate-binding protein